MFIIRIMHMETVYKIKSFSVLIKASNGDSYFTIGNKKPCTGKLEHKATDSGFEKYYKTSLKTLLVKCSSRAAFKVDTNHVDIAL